MVTQEMPQEPIPMGLYQVLMFPGPTLLSLPGTKKDTLASVKRVRGCLTQHWHGPRQDLAGLETRRVLTES